MLITNKQICKVQEREKLKLSFIFRADYHIGYLANTQI